MANTRQPIVTILGHVDHGKTTLLDKVRKTNIATREAGGITQKIGASVVETSDKRKITFIDTPGHAAFEKMRSRGATVADIVILAVAADDGVKPQTKEAIKHIQDAKVPFVVAFTKTDTPGANVEAAKAQLEKEGVFFEGRGGDTPSVALSAKTGEGVESLLEMILLVADITEVKGNLEGDFEGVVIETNKDNRGTAVSLVVRNGTLSVGDDIFSEGIKARVRGLFNDQGKSVKKILPGEPALMLGFSEAPQVGAIVSFQDSAGGQTGGGKKRDIPAGDFLFVIKSGSSGSLEAILSNLPKEAGVISASVGEVSESDVFAAKASGASLLVFETKIPSGVKKLAQTEGVKTYEFKVIYELIERVEEIIKKAEIKILGEAEIIAEFPFDSKRIAGSRVKTGQITKGARISLMRGGQELGKATVTSLKKQKEEVSLAGQGEECGILLKPQLDFKIGDVLVSVAQDG